MWASEDGGESYRTLVAGVAGSEPQLAVLDQPRGLSLALYLRTNGSRPHSTRPSVSRSSDGGRTWSAAAASTVPAQGSLLTSVKAVGGSSGSSTPTLYVESGNTFFYFDWVTSGFPLPSCSRRDVSPVLGDGIHYIVLSGAPFGSL